MKQKDIKVGKTYRNAGAGRTFRTVLSIEPENDKNRPHWWSQNPRPEGMPVVTYNQSGYRSLYTGHLYLKSFAAWAGSEVEF